MENGKPTDDPQTPGLSLSRILDDDSIEHLHGHKSTDTPAEGWDEEATGKLLEEGYCVECEGIPVDPVYPVHLDSLATTPQTSQHRSTVNLVRTAFVRFALRRNIAKDLERNTRPKC